jgi:hypothetical protein
VREGKKNGEEKNLLEEIETGQGLEEFRLGRGPF